MARKPGWLTALAVIGLGLGAGVYVLAGALTTFVPLDPDDWTHWVGLRVAIQLGGSVGLGGLVARRAGLPLALTLVPFVGLGLVLSWSATPDLVEGPVRFQGRVASFEEGHWNYGRNVEAAVCFETDRGPSVCVEPFGPKATRMRGMLARCKGGRMQLTLLRHLDVLLEAECLADPFTPDDSRFEQRQRLGQIAVEEVRLLPDDDRGAWARQVATADPDLLAGVLSVIEPSDRWALVAFEEAMAQRDDYVGLLAARWAVATFPDAAPAMAERLRARRSVNAPTLERHLRDRR